MTFQFRVNAHNNNTGHPPSAYFGLSIHALIIVYGCRRIINGCAWSSVGLVRGQGEVRKSSRDMGQLDRTGHPGISTLKPFCHDWDLHNLQQKVEMLIEYCTNNSDQSRLGR